MNRHFIRLERAGDALAIRRVHEEAFGQKSEADLVDELRAGGFSTVSLVAIADGDGSNDMADTQPIVGHVLFSELQIIRDAGTLAALALAPLAVLPGYQRKGIGKALVEAGLAACRETSYTAIFVVGNPAYYRQFGFSSELAKPFECAYAGEAFMTLELQRGALPERGRIEYAPPFAEL